MHLTMEGVFHAPSAEKKKGNRWYGSEEVLGEWERYLNPPQPATTEGTVALELDTTEV